ncbi:hypothetical protein ACQKJ1_01195 [Methylorubrum rhodesianum]|uniref:hypothetical protein n=1 Tax=Methylorubrum rhodesianum TaxID=29427 RepID=UPI003D04FAFB
MLDDPRYTLSQVAEAAGVQVGTLRSWLQRKHWRLDMAVGDSPAEVAGKAHLITLRRALHIGAAVELVRNDVEPARAFRAALSFVDIFNPEIEAEGRERGHDGLFADGYTLLAVYPGFDSGIVMWVDAENSTNKPGRPPNATPLMSIFFPRLLGGRQVSGTFVWLNQVDRRIRSRLVEAH